MIELSTPVTNASANDTAHNMDEGLGEDDQLFFLSLKNGMNILANQPNPATITNLLNYSKRLKAKS